jgi:hypothetical protein
MVGGQGGGGFPDEVCAVHEDGVGALCGDT